MFKDLFSTINHIQNTISNNIITIETTTALNIIPVIIAVRDISTDITEYAFDLYNHPKGNKCAPKIIAKTITILSGTVEYIHIAINIYKNWLQENKSPNLFKGLSFIENSAFIIFEIIYESGKSGVIKQNVNKFFVRMFFIGSMHTISTAHQIITDVIIKCNPFLDLFAISVLNTSKSIPFPL